VQPEDEICYCFHVSKRKIQNYIRLHRPRVASQISDCGGAGTGCGWCIPFLQKYHRDLLAPTSAAASVPTAGAVDDTVSREEYAQARGAYIRAGKGKPPPGATPPPPPSGGESGSQ
jgi:NAD(P)H-nitrite reductase large subunit